MYFLITNFRNNFENWQKDVVSPFRFDIGKDHSGGEQDGNGSNSFVKLEPLLSSFAGLDTSNCPSKDPGWYISYKKNSIYRYQLPPFRTREVVMKLCIARTWFHDETKENTVTLNIAHVCTIVYEPTRNWYFSWDGSYIRIKEQSHPLQNQTIKWPSSLQD